MVYEFRKHASDLHGRCLFYDWNEQDVEREMESSIQAAFEAGQRTSMPNGGYVMIAIGPDGNASLTGDWDKDDIENIEKCCRDSLLPALAVAKSERDAA